jgi:hypothetical protein
LPHDAAIPAPRVVKLTPELYRLAVAAERDRAVAEYAGGPGQEEARCNAFSGALVGCGVVLAAGGVVTLWDGRGEAWLLVGCDCTRRALVPALRLARTHIAVWLTIGVFRRIEFVVRWQAPWRDSFTRALGFEFEARMRRFGPDGADYGLYARTA